MNIFEILLSAILGCMAVLLLQGTKALILMIRSKGKVRVMSDLNEALFSLLGVVLFVFVSVSAHSLWSDTPPWFMNLLIPTEAPPPLGPEHPRFVQG